MFGQHVCTTRSKQEYVYGTWEGSKAKGPTGELPSGAKQEGVGQLVITGAIQENLLRGCVNSLQQGQYRRIYEGGGLTRYNRGNTGEFMKGVG